MLMTNMEDKIFDGIEKYVENISHAYIFSINNNPNYEEIIGNFIKEILTKGTSEKNKQIIMNQLDSGNHTEIIKIWPDGLNIKKEQIESLKIKFQTKALNSKYKVYVVYEADRLTISASNSMLKFLEEPEENIVAILITNNINNILSTIVSRCQVINIPHFKEDQTDNYYIFNNLITKEEYIKDNYGEQLINNSVNFVIKFEEKKSKMICFTKEYFHNYFTDKKTIEISMQIMIMFYKEILYYINKKKISFFVDYLNQISIIGTQNTMEEIINKINVLVQKKDLIKSNINVNLLIDSLIFDLEGVNS